MRNTPRDDYVSGDGDKCQASGKIILWATPTSPGGRHLQRFRPYGAGIFFGFRIYKGVAPTELGKWAVDRLMSILHCAVYAVGVHCGVRAQCARTCDLRPAACDNWRGPTRRHTGAIPVPYRHRTG
jgi:hypothetical protein